MSIENVKNFYGKMESDEKLVEKLQQSQGDGLEALVAVAKESGYDFSQAEAQQYLSAQAGAGAPEAQLSDEQLETVAGGGGSFGGTCNTAICTITHNTSGPDGRCDPTKSGLGNFSSRR